MNQTVLAVIEDDEAIRDLIYSFFRTKNFKVMPFGDAQSFLKAMKSGTCEPNVVITDLMLPQMDGIELLKQLTKIGCEAPVILLTASDSAETAIRAIEAGAYDFVVKPMTFAQLLVSVERALHFGGIRDENRKLKAAITVQKSQGEIIGKSPGLKQAVDLARRVADSTANIFISGETGTGKEVIARAVHEFGKRSNQPFIAINCSAIPENLLESELFGHAKGAFTGASDKKVGLFEEAGEGTLFLDEIGDLSLPLQAKLLRVLQERKIKRIGENQVRNISARIISATHKDLKEEIQKKTFRDDLYFRLRVIPIHLPPLRERKEDILPLAEHFLRKFVAQNQRNISGFDKGAVEFMLKSPWYGNVRELENSLERAVVLSEGPLVTANDFSFQDDRTMPASTSQQQASDQDLMADSAPMHSFISSDSVFSVDVSGGLVPLEEITKQYIKFAVNRNGGAKDKTALDLGIDRKTLYRRITTYSAPEAVPAQTH